MVNLTQQFLARRQTIIYGVKRGKIPLALRPTVPPQTKQAGSESNFKYLYFWTLENLWSHFMSIAVKMLKMKIFQGSFAK